MKSQIKLSMLVLLSALCAASCKKDKDLTQIEDADATSARTVYNERTLDWNSRTDGTYTTAEATADFGNVSGWNESRSVISAHSCRVTLIANTVGAASGVTSRIDIPDGSNTSVEFDVKFHSEFDFSKGGKIGFGLQVGDGGDACVPVTGNGGSARLMWYTDSRTYFRPYVYYKDMLEDCGEDWGLSYPSTGSLAKNVWYHVFIQAISNTGTNTNGRVTYKVNGVTLLDVPIRWTTNDAKRLVNLIYYSNFRGGSQSYWASAILGHIYFDNLHWKRWTA
jgi:hypothetical protein